jgi:tryptophan 2,3-dioxygenase
MSEIVSSQAIEDLEKKFEAINQKTENLSGRLLWSKPITYWDFHPNRCIH